MQVKLIEAIGFIEGVQKFLEIELPLPVSYKLNKINTAAMENRQFYLTKFREILAKYAKTDENDNPIVDDNNQYTIKDGMYDDCVEELNELDALPVEIETYGLKMEDFGDIKCTPSDFNPIMPFLS